MVRIVVTGVVSITRTDGAVTVTNLGHRHSLISASLSVWSELLARR